MKKVILNVTCICLALFVMQLCVDAAVYTSDKIDTGTDTVYVMGNDDFYPFEYYNSSTNRYEGVLPLFLEEISKRVYIDFTYIHKEKSTNMMLAENMYIEMVSAYTTDSNERFAKDKITVITYESNGKIVNIGWAFTNAADEELITIMKSEAAKITEKEINGKLIAVSNMGNESDNKLFPALLLFGIVALAVLALVLLSVGNTQRQVREHKMIDSETGGGNLAYFEYAFSNVLSDFSRNLYYIAYIIVDSNYIQAYHGEASYVDAIKYTANVLSSYDKYNNISARVTENGFAFVFRSTDDIEAEKLVAEMMEKLNLYMEAEERANPVFHAAVYNLNKNDRNSELLLFNMRRKCSKLVGTDNVFVMCSPDMMNRAFEEKQMIDGILKGFREQEFKLYLQFIVDNKTKKIVSAEALSRWENPHRGVLLPGKYIGIMESTGFIVDFDYYMFEAVCRQLHKWDDTEFDHLTISCNFTRITLSEKDFIEKIKTIASKYVFDKSKLAIEITEDAIEKNLENARNNVFECKKMGFKIALDDMGSGYTSFANLCEYPIDIVKIDRSILLKTDKENGRDLFVGIIALAHSLNQQVVCEGVEIEEQNALVNNTDCDFIQGWYYSKPLPVKAGEEFARTYSQGK